jgi:hypothetical protein
LVWVGGEDVLGVMGGEDVKEEGFDTYSREGASIIGGLYDMGS